MINTLLRLRMLLALMLVSLVKTRLKAKAKQTGITFDSRLKTTLLIVIKLLLVPLQGHGYVNLFRTVRLGGITDSKLEIH